MAQLKELVDIYLGVTHTPEYVEKGVPFLSVKDISGGKICFDDCKYISEDEYNGLSQGAKPQVGDMLFCRVGTIGKPIIIPEGTPTFGSFVSLGYLRNKDANKCSLEYLRYWMYSKSFERQVYANVKGASQVNLNTGWLSKFEVVLPDIIIQKDIVKKLDRCIAVIDRRKQELEELDNLIKSRFVEMFGTVENNVFNYDIKTIGEVATLKSGTSLPSEIENEGGNIPYVKVGDMNYFGNEYYITTSSRYVSEKTAGKGLFEIGTVIFPKRGGAIGTNKKRLTTLPICADLNVMGVTPNKSIILPSYLMTYFDLVDLGGLDNGSSVPQINNKDITPLKICLPPIGLQKQFATFVQQVDKLKFLKYKAL